MSERPHYSKSVAITSSVIKRKLKPRHHSIEIDYKVDLSAVLTSIESARDYNAKHGKLLDSVMVIFYGKTKSGEDRTSASPLVTIGSTNDYIMRYVEKALVKLQQSDASAKFMRIVYDILKVKAQRRAEKLSEAQITQAKNLNVAKSHGFTNYKDYLKALRTLNAKLKHGATEKTLKREAERLAKEKAKLKALKEKAKAKALAARKAKAHAKRQAERVKRLREAAKSNARQTKAIQKSVAKLSRVK